MSVAGIDFSSKAVDVVLLDEDSDRASWHRFVLEGADAFDRARAVRASMPGASFWDDVLAVGIEQPRGRFALVDLGRIQGAVLACIPTSKLVQPWNPAGWRKAVGLPGNCSKAAVTEWTIARRLHSFGWSDYAAGRGLSTEPLWPQDARDAYCVALATRSILEHKEAA